MTVSLYRAYGAYPAGSIVSLAPSTEAAIIQQGIGANSAATPTAGTVSSQEFSGRAAFAAGANSVTINNPNVTANSKIVAGINTGTVDGTLTALTRVVPAGGFFTIYGNANSTGVVPVDWSIVSTGLTPNQ